MFAASFPLIWWNEHRTLQETLTLQEGLKLVQYVPEDSLDQVATGLLGKLVHVAGPITVDTLRDAEFGVAVPALRLTRAVEMYQYREQRRQRTQSDGRGGKVSVTDVSYSPDWAAERVDSSRFEDARYRGRNPARWPVARSVLVASRAAIGAYRLPRSVVESLGAEAPVELTDPSVSAIGGLLSAARSGGGDGGLVPLAQLAPPPSPPAADGRAVAATGGGGGGGGAQQQQLAEAFRGLSAVARGMSLSRADGRLYSSARGPADPAPGDVRVEFRAAAPSSGSVVARLERGGRLEPFVVPATGRQLLLSAEGDVSPGELFQRAHSANALLTWALRGCGWLLAVGGLGLLLQPAAVAPTWIPLVGALAGDVVSCGVALVALLVGTTAAVATIAVAWFAVRPALSLAALAACAAVVYLLRARGTTTRAAAARGGSAPGAAGADAAGKKAD